MTKYLGIDASSKSLAWGMIENDILLSYGEIFITSIDFDKRLQEIRKILETPFFFEIFDEPDYIIFERAIIGPNREVALKLAQMFGAMKSVLLDSKARLIEAPPVAWQEAIGNPVLRGKAKTELHLLHPEWKTKTQINAGIRKLRKSKTQEIIFNTFGEEVSSDNISDAIGLALFAKQVLEKK